jgi:hypothetical protein
VKHGVQSDPSIAHRSAKFRRFGNGVVPVLMLQIMLASATLRCSGLPEHSKDAFTVVGVVPAEGTIQSSGRFEVSFSRQLRPDSITGCSFMLVRDEFTGDVGALFSKDGLDGLNAEKAECAGAEIEISGSVARFAPARRLEPGGKYRIAASPMIRDFKGYKLGGSAAAPYVGGGPYSVSLEGFNPAGEPVLTEIFANPAGDEAGSEFVEVFNPGPDAVDIGFWRLSSSPGFEQMISGCGMPTAIKPGGFGLIVGSDFAPAGIASGTAVGCIHGRIAGKGLLNTAGQRLVLKSADGRETSTYGGWRSSSEDGRSIERKIPGLPDEDASWVLSTVPGGTPGASREPEALAGPARLLRFDPNGTDVGVRPKFTLLFDREAECGKSGNCIRICPDEQCCTSGKGAMEGTATRGAVEEAVEFIPSPTLVPKTGYRLNVSGFRDAATKVATESYCLPFATGDAPDVSQPMARLSYPQDGANGIPRNVALIVVEFQEPIRLLGEGALTVGSGGRKMSLSCMPGPDAANWTCKLPEKLDCGAEHVVAVEGAVADISGNLAARGAIGRFRTSCDDDQTAPELGLTVVSVAPSGFTARWKASEPCICFWELESLLTGEIVEKGVSASVSAEWIGSYGVPISAGDYSLAGRCGDPAGNASNTAVFTIGQSDLPPPVALNEVMANPSGADTGAEYVELYNYGSAPVDLRGWRISRCQEPSKGLDLAGEGGFFLSPGQFAIIVSDKDPGASYPWDAKLIKLANGPLSGGISNSHREEICIFDSGGRTVSSFGGWFIPGEGIPAERVSATGPDCQDNWSASAVKGGTPGAANSSKR